MLLRRATPLLVAAAVLAAPVAAWGSAPSANPGQLSVLRGKGTVDLQARGALIGGIARGRLRIKILKVKHRHGNDTGQVSIRMLGKGTVRHRPDGTTIYKGRRIRIRIVDEKFRIQINGVGIHLSAVAQGTVALQASPLALDPGTFSLNGAAYQPLPLAKTTYQLTAP
jgi:hypothetical protein